MNKKITILGIHYNTHDSSVALIQNGKIHAAVKEESIKNIKHLGGYPIESIKEVFKISKIHPSEVDAIALVGALADPLTSKAIMNPNYHSFFSRLSWIEKNEKGIEWKTFYLERLRNFKKLKNELVKIGITVNELFFVEHHTAHAASAYYTSPWNLKEKILIFTADGEGDGISSTVSIGHNGNIERIPNSESDYHNSLGMFYAGMTDFLGMHHGFDSGKVMGLSPYGNIKSSLGSIKELININKDNPLQFKNNSPNYSYSSNYSYRSQPQLRILEGQRFDNIAAATQFWFEKLMIEWIQHAISQTDIHTIACAGGNFYNVKANKAILSIPEIDDIFISPASGDEGLAVGAALSAYFEFSKRDGISPTKVSIEGSYFGPSFTDEEIKNSLKKYDLVSKSNFTNNIEEEVGELLAKKDFIIARFNDKMEWGPRALGNRSILANPSNLNVVKKINKAIKMRDFWMPFGPSILSSRVNDYVANGRVAPYMTLAFDTTEKRDDMVAAIHPYDNTCRPQTVDKTYNSKYENLISSFESKTGIGAILNTSFNLHGSPMVHSPDIAIDTFKKSSLDCLALGNYLIFK